MAVVALVSVILVVVVVVWSYGRIVAWCGSCLVSASGKPALLGLLSTSPRMSRGVADSPL